ncbi:MAG: Ada metal-binding domain-containing protein [Sedimentisphaerales bacterium]
MKTKAYYLILVIAVGFFSVPVPGQVELPPPGEEPLFINQPHPALAGIDKLHVAVLRYGTRPEKDVPVWKQLEKNVKEKLRQAGIELDTPTADNILSIPELRISVTTLSLEDSQQRVFHIRTALARAVCLKDERNPVFRADIWQSAPVMQAVSAENMSAKVTDVVLEQVEGFINIHKSTNPAGTKSSDADINKTALSKIPEKQDETDVNSAISEHKYVASKSSNVFHKSECRWGKNISAQNLVSYKSKDEAIKAGKRPCKTCNP